MLDCIIFFMIFIRHKKNSYLCKRIVANEAIILCKRFYRIFFLYISTPVLSIASIKPLSVSLL